MNASIFFNSTRTRNLDPIPRSCRCISLSSRSLAASLFADSRVSCPAPSSSPTLLQAVSTPSQLNPYSRLYHNSGKMASKPSDKVYFSSFDVTSQVFYFNSSKSIAGIVNLKPIVPCHVLLIPTICYKRFSDLPSDQVAELFQSVQHVSNVLKKELKADALTISIQDGEEAGQSVPHLHVHILPRRKGDFEPNDKIYPLLEKFGHSLSTVQSARERGGIPDDEDRKARSDAEMTSEATFLRNLM